MSHFSVMVFEDPSLGLEKQLAPFHEFECTGYDDEYVQEIDRTDEVLEQLAKFEADGVENPLQETLEWYGYEPLDREEDAERDGNHKFGFAVVKDGRIVKAIWRTNPNDKWDWWTVGGRWSKFLKLKGSDEWVNSARKGDIDWEGMRDKGANEAGEKWDKIRELAPNGWESWESVRERFKKEGMERIGMENIDAAREFYHGQEGRIAIRQSDDLIFVEDDVLVDRAAYVQRARKRSVSPFAMLKDGNWMEKGEMWWWAIVSNEMPENDWYDQVWETIQSASDDTVIHVVDCHI